MLNAITNFFMVLLSLLTIEPNKINEYKKQFETINYGLKVDVDGHNMSVVIAGDQHDQIIVFLPALGAVAPYISYKSFTESLSENFKVISIEPFGYGLSDVTEKERTNENIVSEIHTCLQKLGVNRFYFMGHSIGGFYSLAYAEKYPDEVLGFIGLDNTPNNVEEIIEPESVDQTIENTISRIKAKYHLWVFASEEEKQQNTVLDPNYKYTEEDMKNYDVIFRYTCTSENCVDEYERLKSNMESLKNAHFKCPVLMFIASDTCKAYPTIWKQSHEAMITNLENSEVIELEASHMIHIDQKDYILKKVKEWIK